MLHLREEEWDNTHDDTRLQGAGLTDFLRASV